MKISWVDMLVSAVTALGAIGAFAMFGGCR